MESGDQCVKQTGIQLFGTTPLGLLDQWSEKNRCPHGVGSQSQGVNFDKGITEYLFQLHL